MRRSWPIWFGFTLCLAVVLAAMGWISLKAVRSEWAEAEARQQEAKARQEEAEAQQKEREVRRQAALEENVRLALWRIDTTLAPLIAQESARPYFAYSSFLTIDRAYTRMFNNDRSGGETLLPSPLLDGVSANILVHFQFDPDGTLTSPQVPTEANRKLAVPRHVSAGSIARAEKHLAALSALLDRDKLAALLPEHTPTAVQLGMNPLEQKEEQRLAQRTQRRMNLDQFGRGAVEFQERNQAQQSIANTAVGQQSEFNYNGQLLTFFNGLPNGVFVPATDVVGVPMTPLWIDGELILARRITIGGRQYLQGCLLSWPAIKAKLLEDIEDLLPQADLERAEAAPGRLDARMLAALPVRLLPGPRLPAGQDIAIPVDVAVPAVFVPEEPRGLLSPIMLSLAVAWVGVLLAAAAVAGLLSGVIRLSERRASFVTAVTHELRTPLTTFQMYAEMLSEGMVSDPAQQQSYLSTLHRESVRLTHLVENVLSYARLERGRAGGRVESMTVDELLAPLKDRLADRASQAGMELVVESQDGAGSALVRTKTSAVEQILLNLVDNACKYAAAAADRRIELGVQPAGKSVQLRVRDHGPGVSPAARRRLFRSFSKSAQEAAQTAPGVGLGLALSRRLARDMHGELWLDHHVGDGACFVLQLPAER